MAKSNSKMEAIWKKLLSWGLVSDKKSYHWFELYKLCCVKIYQMDIDFLKENLIKFKDMKQMETMIATDYNDVVHIFMALICYFSTDILILDWYFENFHEDLDMNHLCTMSGTDNDIGVSYTNYKLNFLALCLEKKNKSLSVIKYLAEKCKVSPIFIPPGQNMEENCVDTMIFNYNYTYGSDLKIIKYFIDELRVPIDKIGLSDDRDILVPVFLNPTSDIKLIKYFVEEKNYYLSWDHFNQLLESYQDVSTKEIINDKNKLKNLGEKVKYLINNLDIDDDSLEQHPLSFPYKFDPRILKECLKFIKDQEKYDLIVDSYDLQQQVNQESSNFFMDSFDQMILKKKQRLPLVKNNPFKLKYKDFVDHVDHFKPLMHSYDSFIHDVDEKQSQLVQALSLSKPKIDFSDPDHNKKPIELLFYVDQIPYHGDKKIIYDQMLIFKDNEIQFNESVTLGCKMKKYLVNLYLNTLMTGHIDLNEIDPCDIFDFLKFIEQYPATSLSIESIEKQLIDYFNLNDICLDDEIKMMFERCGLKLMYLYMNHNKKYNSLCYKNYDSDDENDEIMRKRKKEKS